jgi:hypothetical protein
MTRQFISALIISALSCSCVKERTCECVYKNGGGVASSGQITGKRKESKRICEALSSTTTDCYLK